MDKEEDARMASENERLRRLMLEGIIENPHDYRAIIHGEHTQHRRTKKKKRSKRKVLITCVILLAFSCASRWPEAKKVCS